MTIEALSNTYLRVNPRHPAFFEALKQLVTVSSLDNCALTHLLDDPSDTNTHSPLLREKFITHMTRIELSKLEQSRRVVSSALQQLEELLYISITADQITDWIRILNEARHKLFAEHSFSENEMGSQLDETHSSANTPLFKYGVYSYLLEQLVKTDAQRLFSKSTPPTTCATYSSSSMTTNAP
jgi:hypothetical protein